MRASAQRAFTLIEVAAVVVILGLAVTAVTWSLGDRVRSAKLTDVAGELAIRDAMARAAARRTGEASYLRFDLNAGTLSRLDPPLRHPTPPAGTTDRIAELERVSRAVYRLPVGFEFAEIRLADAVHRFGERTIVVSATGVTADYAVRLSDRSGDTIWMLFVGLTGRWMPVADQGMIDAITERLKTDRPDAR